MRVNYREVLSRFGHVDGRIASAVVSLTSDVDVPTARVVVRLYPWWEHPMYLAARSAGSIWGFNYGDEAARDMVIEAVSPLRCDVRIGRSATEILFSTHDPRVWEFEDEAEIVVNSALDHRELLQGVSRRLVPNVPLQAIAEYISPFASHKPPYSLGDLPFTLLGEVKAQLQAMGVRFFVAREPTARRPAVLLSIDDNIVIAAEDFILDVPEFEHRPEWFSPRGLNGPG